VLQQFFFGAAFTSVVFFHPDKGGGDVSDGLQRAFFRAAR
jgi:hypothetical protein